MDDLSERDLSDVPDADLTPEERQEIQRRLDAFVERMQLRRHSEPAEKPEPKRVMRWHPTILSRRH